MVDRMGSTCWLLLWVLMVGCSPGETMPVFTWTGRWEKTGLEGCYHSYIKMADGRIACFQNRFSEKTPFGELVVSFTREAGNLFTWTPYAPLMASEAIPDLPDPADPNKPAPNRLLTRPTVVRLPSGNFLGMGAICRDYPPVDGLFYVVSYSGSAERVNVVKEALLAGREVPKSAMWKYEGRVKGPVGEYQDTAQTPYSKGIMYTSVGSLIFLPEGPTKPDHARPTRNRFLLFANSLGSPDLQDELKTYGWTSLCYSADGREWFFAKDAAGAVRNVTPFHGDNEGYIFPFVFRHAADEWWMWRSNGFFSAETDPPLGAHDIFLYFSRDGLNWQHVRADVSCKDFPGSDGKPLGLKNMSIYYDAETKQIHGMLSVWNEKTQDWCKYHNIARVTTR